MYSIAVILSLCACLEGHRVARKAGDQATEGACQNFKWGGTSRVHFYTCCNNCNERDTSCNRKTYHSASGGLYCDQCGTDSGNGNHFIAFHVVAANDRIKIAMLRTFYIHSFYGNLQYF